jgi:hypothetical protein
VSRIQIERRVPDKYAEPIVGTDSFVRHDSCGAGVAHSLERFTSTLACTSPMHSKLTDWKNGWFGVELGIGKHEIDVIIDHLKMLKEEPDQHFHVSSDYKTQGGLGDITIYVQTPEEQSNMETLGKALEPGADASGSVANKSPEPAPAAGTPPARQEPRHA